LSLTSGRWLALALGCAEHGNQVAVLWGPLLPLGRRSVTANAKAIPPSIELSFEDKAVLDGQACEEPGGHRTSPTIRAFLGCSSVMVDYCNASRRQHPTNLSEILIYVPRGDMYKDVKGPYGVNIGICDAGNVGTACKHILKCRDVPKAFATHF